MQHGQASRVGRSGSPYPLQLADDIPRSQAFFSTEAGVLTVVFHLIQHVHLLVLFLVEFVTGTFVAHPAAPAEINGDWNSGLGCRWCPRPGLYTRCRWCCRRRYWPDG